MDTERWMRVKELFKESVQMNPAERRAFLKEACREDSFLLEAVRSLLVSHESSESFLETPTEAGVSYEGPGEKLVGTRIGNFLLQRLISTGGMGSVYEALQEQPERIVAVKVMKEGLATRSALRRFEYEAQVLARLRHPGIAQVIEAGTHGDGGLPYFVMEYIEGASSITDHAGKKALATSERLELFLRACEAVHHGHQKGVIHRDLKPSNILVDAQGQVKIIDFGVARATDADVTLATTPTELGELVGTVQYMSPEQCKADPSDLDIRSDVYALGVVLYELLCEELPYDVRRALVFEATRIIREEEPRHPSTIRKSLRGDVETIMLKALEKDRGHRYQSVVDFGEDIRRFLKGEVILAKPAGPATRFWKGVKRNPVFSATAGVALLACLAFFAYVVFWSYPRIKAERNKAVKAMIETDAQRKEALAAKGRAEKEAAKAAAVVDFVGDMFWEANPAKGGREVKVVEVLKDATERIGEDFSDQPEVETELRAIIGWTYTGLGQYREAEEQLRSGIEINRRIYGEEDLLTLRMESRLGAVLKNQGRLSEAEELLRRVGETQRRLLGNEDDGTLMTLSLLADVLLSRGAYDEMESLIREILETRRRLLGEEHKSTILSLGTLASLLSVKGKLDEAEALDRKVLELNTALHGEEHVYTSTSMNNLAIVLLRRGKYAEAEVMLQECLKIRKRILGDEHRLTFVVMYNIANALKRQGKRREAEAKHREVLTLRRDILGPGHPDTLTSMDALALILKRRGAYTEAEELFHESLKGYSRLFDEQHPLITGGNINLAMLFFETGRLDEAEATLRDVLEIEREFWGFDHPDTLTVMNNLALLLKAKGGLEEAEAMFREVVEARSLALDPEHPLTLTSKFNLALVCAKMEKYSEAEQLHREVFEARERVLNPSHPDLFISLANLGLVLQDLERHADSEEVLAQGVERVRERMPEGHEMRALIYASYGESLALLDRFIEAEEYLLDGYRIYKDRLGTQHARTRIVGGWIVELYELWGKPEEAASWLEKLKE